MFSITPTNRWQFLLAGFLISVIFSTGSALADDDALHELIDKHIVSGFAKWNASSAQRCTDEEFVRRVYLDLTGSIPDAKTAREFIANAAADKRAKLIDGLLNSDAFALHMASVFDVMLMERRPDKYVTTEEWRNYLRESFASNKPLDVLAAEILGGDGVDEKLRPAAKFYLDRAVDKDTLVRDIGRLFIGVDLQCAQCHDHPSIDGYLHEHYYGLSVFVAGSKTFKQPDGKMVLQETVMREVEFASVFDPDTTRKTGPRLLNALMEIPELVEGDEYVEKPSRTVRSVPKFSLRNLLAEKLPSEETPEFARNMANRMWAMMMGRGIVEPLDMHHSANAPSHPELLELLAGRLTKSKFDVRGFLRELALSETYQRSSVLPEGIDLKSVPPESFAVANMKGLSPEQLFASLIQATGSRQVLDEQIEEALKEDESAYEELLADGEKIAKARTGERAERIKEFVNLFGSTPGRPEGEFQASLPHALFFANSETVISWIEPRSDNLTQRLLKIDDTSKVIEESYLSVLSRMPTDDELKQTIEHLTKRESDRRAAVIELVWSLVASAEFRLNH
jgi:hypothetical protein